jgi:hypothetical protein
MIVPETGSKAAICFEMLGSYIKISLKLPPLDLPED